MKKKQNIKRSVGSALLAVLMVFTSFLPLLTVAVSAEAEHPLAEIRSSDGKREAEPDREGIIGYTVYSEVPDYESITVYYLTGIAILFPIANMLIMFVDRAISIVLLFIVSPYSIATNVLDDGAHFKLWREQILTKFVTGYGCILGLNIYALIIKLVIGNGVVFFPETGTQLLPILSNSFLNSLMKIVIILGGAFSLQRIMAVIGNLVSAGGGSNELRDMALTGAQMGKFLGGAAKLGLGAARGVLTAPRAFFNFGKDSKHYGAGSTMMSRMGLRTEKDYHRPGWTPDGEENDRSDQHNGSGPDYLAGSADKNSESSLENIISAGSGSDSANNASPATGSGKQDAVSNTILNGSSGLGESHIGSINDPDEEDEK